LIYRTVGGVLIESFAQAFSKACRSRRDRRSPVATGETPLILPKRHERVNFGEAERGNTFANGKGGERFATGEVNNTQVGVFPFSTKANLKSFSAFLLMQ